MAETAFEKDVMQKLLIIEKDLSHLKKLETQMTETRTIANEAKEMAEENREALYGDEKSTDTKKKGIIGAIIEMRQEIKSNARWTAVLMAAINVAGIIIAAMFAAGVFQ